MPRNSLFTVVVMPSPERIGDSVAAFPVSLGPEDRLVMKNGRDWWVVDTNRNCLAQGTLKKAFPVFAGVNPVKVATADEAKASARVRLVKRYVTSKDSGFDRYEGRPAKSDAGGRSAGTYSAEDKNAVQAEGYQDDGTERR